MILRIFLFWRFGLFLITYLGSMTIPLVANGGVGAIGTNKQFGYWASWAQWDGGHYLDIAQHGYILNSDFAFFPIYPLLIKSTSFFLANNFLISGLLISNISFVIFLFIFYKLVKEKYSESIAFHSVITFLVFPTTFFAASYYSESIFLLLVVLIFVSLNRQQFLQASIVASIASLTRFIGVFLLLPLVYFYFARINFKLKRINGQLAHIIPALFGIVLYGLYSLANFNNPLKFLSVQTMWERQILDPISTISSYIWAIFIEGGRPVNDHFDLLLTLLFLAILIAGIKKISSSLWIFSMLVILIPASSGTLTSMPRYLLASIGAFIILGQYLNTRPKLRLVVWIFSLTLQAILAVRFINGYWVA